jgi:hypothetical protein
MSHKDALEIYDNLLAAGISKEQAHAQARAISDSIQVTKQDIKDIRNDFANAMDKIILKMDLSYKYLSIGIGGVFLAVVVNIFQGLLSK